jgi:hypothetical protein
MEEIERYYSFVLSQTPHETKQTHKFMLTNICTVRTRDLIVGECFYHYAKSVIIVITSEHCNVKSSGHTYRLTVRCQIEYESLPGRETFRAKRRMIDYPRGGDDCADRNNCLRLLFIRDVTAELPAFFPTCFISE